MKKLYIAVLAVASLLVSGCDIERLPYGSYSAETIQKDKAEALDILLNGCYAQLRSATDVMHRTGEYPGDNIMKQNATTNNFSQYMSYKHTATNNHLPSVWNNGYKIIAQASNIIKMIEEGESPEVDQKLGEAYFMRGMMYFYLCRIFGMPYYQSPESHLAVPIVDIPDNLDGLVLPDRSTVKDVYAQAVADLRRGEKLMTVYKSAIYASKYSAQALLSKMYAYMSGTYENPDLVYADSSYYYANEVIKSGKFELLSRDVFMTYNQMAPDSKSQVETIFAVKRLDAEISNYNPVIGSMYASIQDVGWGEIYTSKKYLDLLDETGYNDWANENFVDARAAFIHPQYKVDKTGKKIRAFRFVYEIYNDKGELTGYGYQQPEIQDNAGALTVVFSETEKYPLTAVDALKHRYSIDYKGKTYVGVDDYYITLNNGYPMFFSYKCSLEDGIPQLHSPIVARLAEMYLLCAEAAAKKGNYELAKTNLNKVRERSLPGKGYSALNAGNAKSLIMKERQLELAYEADRGFDVYRVGEKMVRRYPGFYNTIWEIEPTSPLVVQLIPQSEINAYPGTLTQNPIE
ncbi:RagB/SusD family nutrient uptake outer membrane protein [Bacteroides sp.]